MSYAYYTSVAKSRMQEENNRPALSQKAKKWKSWTGKAFRVEGKQEKTEVRPVWATAKVIGAGGTNGSSTASCLQNLPDLLHALHFCLHQARHMVTPFRHLLYLQPSQNPHFKFLLICWKKILSISQVKIRNLGKDQRWCEKSISLDEGCWAKTKRLFLVLLLGSLVHSEGRGKQISNLLIVDLQNTHRDFILDEALPQRGHMK